MISDNERREVARKLREINPYRNHSYTIPYHRYIPAVEYLSELARALGYSPKNDVTRLEFQNRLADFIEPSCDRDALMELADEMGRVRSKCDFCIKKGDCDWADETICLESHIDDYAHRIRKALGACDDN